MAMGGRGFGPGDNGTASSGGFGGGDFGSPDTASGEGGYCSVGDVGLCGSGGDEGDTKGCSLGEDRDSLRSFSQALHCWPRGGAAGLSQVRGKVSLQA